MKSIALVAAGLVASTAALGTRTLEDIKLKIARANLQKPSEAPVPNQYTIAGCYKSAGELVFNSTLQWNSQGSCASAICQKSGFPVSGLSGSQCFCGQKYPPKSSLVDDSKCSTPCPGFPSEPCGAASVWTVYNNGLSISVQNTPNAPGDSDSSANADTDPTATGSGKVTAIITQPGSTVVVTQVSSAKTEAPSSSSSTNTGGIIAGVVVAVVVLVAAAVGMFFFLRRRRNKEIEEEYRRNAAVSSFNPGSTSGGTSITDARLDPVMAQRRMSDGSIADNHDYTRKILRV
ncbi:hypothetical protein B0T24DRAFT_648737 [Lasiosphaeria ovina]|uniref:WSC domain-containing protein n=1 Tax=Lasiosphaeria ovina TaxID=92902 RepID=A0AAE0KHV3_9PEZI|nr:hypothetical protein B0T24DRAFT_648737 [Lasiosphaeria ovina]